MTASIENGKKMLEALPWWDFETHYRAVSTWYQEHGSDIKNVGANRWEAILRAGEDRTTFAGYRDRLRLYLIEHDENGEETRYRYGFSGDLTHALLRALDEAVKPDDSLRSATFKRFLEGLPPADAEHALSRLQLRQAREFMSALVLRIRVDRAGREKKR